MPMIVGDYSYVSFHLQLSIFNIKRNGKNIHRHRR